MVHHRSSINDSLIETFLGEVVLPEIFSKFFNFLVCKRVMVG
jgi:hypothetical protein